MRSTSDYTQIPITLGEQGYDVLIGEGLIPGLGTLLEERGLKGKIALISTEPILEMYGHQARSALEDLDAEVHILTMGEGEENKSLATVERLYDELLERKFERSSTVVALGGGVVGDTAGFVAATLMRGVNLVQVPTTILAQVDASIGGKVGVNHRSGKNLVGAIYQPRLVVADTSTLATLDDREVRSGLAEVIKYGMIRDPGLFAYLEDGLDALLSREPQALRRAIVDCCRIKASVVQADEHERNGLRAILNYGHTLGHAIEALGGFDRWRHGEAIAIGMVAAAQLGTLHDGFPEDQRDRFVRLIKRVGFALGLNGIGDDEILKRTRSDKKVFNGQVRYVIPRQIGEVGLADGITDTEVKASLDFVRTLDG